MLTLVLLPLGVSDVVKISNFGAFVTYTVLNICVVACAKFREHDRGRVLRYVVLPGLGVIICIAIVASLPPIALMVGAIWTVLGIIYYIVVLA